jgi:predicted Zn-dependent protease
MLNDLQRQESFMKATASRDSARSLPEWALSHPLTEHRIQRARERAEETGLKNDALPENAASYLAQVDGLLYGDDPQQGFVIGRRFAHPVMRILFEAPAGFSLSNSPQAVRLSGPAGISGEFGGGRLPTDGLQAYAQALAQNVVGDTPAQVQSATATRINGLPAVIMQIAVSVRDGIVPLSIAAYDGGGGEAYHFIVISPPANPRAAAVTALFQSFRRLSAQEAATLRPRIVRTLRVAPGDTKEKLIRKTIDPAPRALFELLNAEYQDGSVGAAQVVKIVTYGEAG